MGRTSILVCLLLLALAPLARGEEIEAFLKRFGTGATAADMHENFHGTVIANGKAYDVDRDAILKNVAGQKDAGTVLTVDELKIVSRSETANLDDGGAVISLVVQVAVTEKLGPKAGGGTVKIRSEDHHVIVREPDGAFRSLYLVVTKQTRKV